MGSFAQFFSMKTKIPVNTKKLTKSEIVSGDTQTIVLLPISKARRNDKVIMMIVRAPKKSIRRSLSN